LRYFVEQAQITQLSREESNEEESVSARNGTRDERWFRACSRHVNPVANNAEDLPGPNTVPVCAADSVDIAAAKFGSIAACHKPDSIVVFIDVNGA
jgi:hypothetical protein